MKNVLIITSSYPPQRGGGVIRPSRLAKYLPEWGWGPVILTMPPPNSHVKDDSVAGDIECNVYRAPRMDLAELFQTIKQFTKKIFLHSESKGNKGEQGVLKEKDTNQRRKADYFFVPDPSVFWIPGAFLLALTSIITKRIKVIYSTSPDPSTHLVAYLLKMTAGRPWIAEFRDPWMANPFRRTRPFAWQEVLESKLEKLVLCNADCIVVTSLHFKEEFLTRFPGLKENHVHYIPNGFDPQDFENIVPEKFEKLTILHAGNFYEARSSVDFLKGMYLFLTQNTHFRPLLQVVFIGNLDVQGKAVVEELELEDVVCQKGVVSHRESIQYICGADILLLVPGPGKGTMTGKIFEYLAAKKPILALADEGPARDLVNNSGIGKVSPAHDIEAISKCIEGLVHLSLNGGYPYQDTSDIQRQYNRRHIAGQVAKLLETV